MMLTYIEKEKNGKKVTTKSLNGRDSSGGIQIHFEKNKNFIMLLYKLRKKQNFTWATTKQRISRELRYNYYQLSTLCMNYV